MLQIIKCPKCGTEINLPEAMSKEIEDQLRQENNQKLSVLNDKLQKETETKINQEKARLKEELDKKALEIRKIENDSKQKEQQLIKDYESNEKQLIEKAKKETEDSFSVKLNNFESLLNDKNKKLTEAAKKETELFKVRQELEDTKRQAEIETLKRIEEERKTIVEKLEKDFEEKHRLMDAEKEKKINDMTGKIKELERASKQGSQQLQGEVLELEVENLLKREFPCDDIEPVKKGQKGGDVIQTVKTANERICGKILWETKRTKSWSDDWIVKLKDDQRDIKADIAVIVSEVLPKDYDHFCLQDGVWVSDIPSVKSLALALRMALIEVENMKEKQTGKESKMEMIYNYLTGTDFNNRVQVILESFLAMKESLDKEKLAMEKIWAAREKQIGKVFKSIAGMKGDLEGIAGPSLPTIQLLELPSENQGEI